MERYSVVGKSLPRVDSLEKVTGEAKYAADHSLPGMLFGKVLRSPYAHARLLHIDTTKAERLFGVRAVVKGGDFPGKKIGFIPQTRDLYPLALNKVRFVGEGIVGVAAIDEDIAQEALSLIEVEYEELPAVFDPLKAMEDGSPQIHDHVQRNIGVQCHLSFANIDEAFKEAYHIREERFTTQSIAHGFIEPHACIANFDSTGKLTLIGSKQSPYIVYRQMAMGLDLPLSKVRIIQSYVGGGFGGKHEPFFLDFAAAVLSKKAGRPVKSVDSMEEVLAAGRFRHAMILSIKMAVKKDGHLLGCQLRNIADGGAYSSVGALSIYLPGAFLTLPYRIPHVKYDAYRVYTNKPFCGALRGHCLPQLRFAFEGLLDIIAHEIGIDTIEIRLRNAVQPGDETVNGIKVVTCGFTECIKTMEQSIKWKEKKGKGIGISAATMCSGARLMGHSASSALVKVHEDGAVTLLTGATDVGQGSSTVLSQILAEELGVNLEDVRISLVDSEITPIDPGTFGARVTFCSGNAVKAAALDAKRQLAQVAAEKLEASSEDIEFRERKVFVRGSPEQGMPLRQLIKITQYNKGQPVLGRGYYTPDLEVPDFRTGGGNMSLAYSFAAQAAEVEVDPETGQVSISKMAFSHDCGLAINPMSVEGQLEGGMVHMLGQTLYEDLVRENGQTLNLNFLDYKIPTAMEIPEEVESMLVEKPDPAGPFGAKEAGEGTSLGTMAVIANALYDAVGIRFKDLPITPEKMLNALEDKSLCRIDT